MRFIIQFIHKGIIAVIGESAAFSLNQQLAQVLAPGFRLLEYSKACSDNLAGRSVATALELLGDKVVKMFTEGYAGVFGHDRIPDTNIRYFMVPRHERLINFALHAKGQGVRCKVQGTRCKRGE